MNEAAGDTEIETRLRAELITVRTRKADLRALDARGTQLEREIAELDAQTNAPPPRLETRVASPCKEPWDAMIGSDSVRHCRRCAKDVHDLSAMTRAQVDALLAQQSAGLCVRFYRRPDGTVMTSDCPDRARQRLRVLRTLGVGVATALSASSAISVTPALPVESVARQLVQASATDHLAVQRLVVHAPGVCEPYDCNEVVMGNLNWLACCFQRLDRGDPEAAEEPKPDPGAGSIDP